MELFGRDFASCKCYGIFCSWERWIRPSGHQKPWRRNAIVTLDGGLQKSLNSEIPDWRTWVTWKRCKSHQKSSDEETQANMFNETYSLHKSKWKSFFPARNYILRHQLLQSCVGKGRTEKCKQWCFGQKEWKYALLALWPLFGHFGHIEGPYGPIVALSRPIAAVSGPVGLRQLLPFSVNF